MKDDMNYIADKAYACTFKLAETFVLKILSLYRYRLVFPTYLMHTNYIALLRVFH